MYTFGYHAEKQVFIYAVLTPYCYHSLYIIQMSMIWLMGTECKYYIHI